MNYSLKNENLHEIYFNKKTMKEKEKILDLARELYNKWEISKFQLEETYKHNFLKKEL